MDELQIAAETLGIPLAVYKGDEVGKLLSFLVDEKGIHANYTLPPEVKEIKVSCEIISNVVPIIPIRG